MLKSQARQLAIQGADLEKTKEELSKHKEREQALTNELNGMNNKAAMNHAQTKTNIVALENHIKSQSEQVQAIQTDVKAFCGFTAVMGIGSRSYTNRQRIPFPKLFCGTNKVQPYIFCTCCNKNLRFGTIHHRNITYNLYSVLICVQTHI